MTEKLIDTETMETINPSSKDWTFQNRDVIKWMDRICRGKEYESKVNEIITALNRVLSGVSKEVFSTHWRNNFEAHENPNGLNVDVDIKAPVIKKLHKDGDTDEFFVYYKDYPFYYTWNMFLVFSIVPSDDKMKQNEEYYKSWYVATMSEKIQNDMLRMIRKSIDEKFTGVFAFPKNKDEFEKSKINIIVSSSMRFSEANERKSQTALFKASKDYAEIIVHELSIAIGRILNPTEKDSEVEEVKSDAN